ncbi:hypothetical protein Q3G72_011668 [Acer saccharum]|nr:hypothetical protein Q3G72_011668 [Acer saccharum]
MTRKKVKLCYIADDSTRKVTFKKRKKGLLKKVSELSILCGIDACAIVYSPYNNQPDVWPSHHERIMKSNDQLIKQRKDNREKEMIQFMFKTLVGRSLLPLGMEELNDLGRTIDQYLKDIYKYQHDTNNRMSMVAES